MKERTKHSRPEVGPIGYGGWYGPGSVWNEIFKLSTYPEGSASHLQVLYEPQEDLVLVTACAQIESYGNTPDGQSNEFSEGKICVKAQDFLTGLASAQTGRVESLKGIAQSDDSVSLTVSPSTILVTYRDIYGPPAPTFDLAARQHNFLFLDSLSVIEDGYKRKKDTREIELSLVEQQLLEIARENPEIVHGFEPRAFEYFVGVLLTKLGFSKVRLSRYWNDSGRDLWAVFCEGDVAHLVVVEVKHLSKGKVGIEIVDRLNGVRDRDGASRGMVVTNSSFSKQAANAYRALRDRIALVDYNRLVGLLQDSPSWHNTPSGLWTPAGHSGVLGRARRNGLEHQE